MKGDYMNKKMIIGILALLLAATTMFAKAPVQASTRDESSAMNEVIQNEVDEISEDLTEARKDGKISFFDEIVATYDVSQEAKDAFNDMAMEQAKEEIGALPPVSTNSEENINETKTIDLDCGAQLIISIYSEDVSSDQTIGAVSQIFETIIQSANAYDMTYGTKRYYQSATTVAAGWVTIKSWTTVTASSNGMKITKVDCESDSALLMTDLEKKRIIEDQYADVAGSNCHSRAGVKYNIGAFGLHGPSDWYNLRVTFTITKIDKANKKVYYKYDKDAWQSNTWY